MTPPDAWTAWLEFVVLLGAVLGAAGVLWHRVAVPTIRAAVREAIAPEISRLQRIEGLVDKELKVNGGSSIKDQVNTMSHRLDRIEGRLDGIESRQ